MDGAVLFPAILFFFYKTIALIRSADNAWDFSLA